ncbi:MAG: hypothetical protein ACKO1J_01140 [Tagaea sp.]
MARPMQPLPEPVKALVDHDARCIGAAAFALAASDRPREAQTAELTRAQRAKLSRRVRAWLGVRDEAGRPKGSSRYAFDDIMVTLAMERLQAESNLAPETAARQVRDALITEIDRVPNGEVLWPIDTRGDWFGTTSGRDAERIAEKVRDRLAGPEICDQIRRKKAERHLAKRALGEAVEAGERDRIVTQEHRLEAIGNYLRALLKRREALATAGLKRMRSESA